MPRMPGKSGHGSSTVVADPAVIQLGPCACDSSGEATAIGEAVCQMRPEQLEGLLEGGSHLVNMPCHRMKGRAGDVSDEYSLERSLASHDLAGLDSKPDADAVITLLLRHGANPAKQTKSSEEGDALMKRLVDYALRPDTNPEIFEHLITIGAAQAYPGGRQAMRDIIQPRETKGHWYARHMQALLPKAVVKPGEPRFRTPSLTSLSTIEDARAGPPTPTPTQVLPTQGPPYQRLRRSGPESHQPLAPVLMPVEVPEANASDPTCVRRPDCGCPPGIVHQCPRYGVQYGHPATLAQQPTVTLLYCRCGRRWVECAADYAAGTLKH